MQGWAHLRPHAARARVLPGPGEVLCVGSVSTPAESELYAMQIAVFVVACGIMCAAYWLKRCGL